MRFEENCFLGEQILLNPIKPLTSIRLSGGL